MVLKPRRPGPRRSFPSPCRGRSTPPSWNLRRGGIAGGAASGSDFSDAAVPGGLERDHTAGGGGLAGEGSPGRAADLARAVGGFRGAAMVDRWGGPVRRAGKPGIRAVRAQQTECPGPPCTSLGDPADLDRILDMTKDAMEGTPREDRPRHRRVPGDRPRHRPGAGRGGARVALVDVDAARPQLRPATLPGEGTRASPVM
jgi:hypothetical protein